MNNFKPDRLHTRLLVEREIKRPFHPGEFAWRSAYNAATQAVGAQIGYHGSPEADLVTLNMAWVQSTADRARNAVLADQHIAPFDLED